MNRLFVGNLALDVSSAQLHALFDERGSNVTRAWVAKDKANGRPRGFGFVDLPSPEEAEQAIDLVDGLELRGRALVVRDAGPWVPRAPLGRAPTAESVTIAEFNLHSDGTDPRRAG
jgi:RNA recognition motif-containing protein